MADAGYNIPVSVSDAAAENSGGDFYGGTVQFDFGSGSQAGAPVYQQTNPTLPTTANSAAALGGPASTSSSAPVSTGTGSASSALTGAGISTTDLLILAGTIAVIATLVMLKKDGHL